MAEPERADVDRPGRAVVVLGHITAERLLNLPPGTRIVSVAHDFSRLAVLFGVEADWIPPTPETCHPLELNGTFEVETMVDDEGRTWCRWHWGNPLGAQGG